MRRKLLAGNWKMNKSLAEMEAYFSTFNRELAKSQAESPQGPEVWFSIPMTFLTNAKSVIGSYAKFGSQTVHYESSGAYTGEVTVEMIKETGASFALIGHSERRQYNGENDVEIGKKVKACLSGGLTPVLCVGETLNEREMGLTQVVLAKQINTVFEFIDDIGDLVIAYEPVWAIGTGLNATVEQAQEAHYFIRELVKQRFGDQSAGQVRILYGGSAKPENIKGLTDQDDVDGGLVGGASLNPSSFASMASLMS